MYIVYKNIHQAVLGTNALIVFYGLRIALAKAATYELTQNSKLVSQTKKCENKAAKNSG